MSYRDNPLAEIAHLRRQVQHLSEANMRLHRDRREYDEGLEVARTTTRALSYLVGAFVVAVVIAIGRGIQEPVSFWFFVGPMAVILGFVKIMLHALQRRRKEMDNEEMGLSGGPPQLLRGPE